MTKEKRNLIVTLIIAFMLLLTSIVIAILIINDNRTQKTQTLYISIYRYQVKDYHFSYEKEPELLYQAEFNDDLVYDEIIETEHGYNHIVIKDGIAKITEADCRGKNCTFMQLSNDDDLLNIGAIQCQPHGLEIRWEVK